MRKAAPAVLASVRNSGARIYARPHLSGHTTPHRASEYAPRLLSRLSEIEKEQKRINSAVLDAKNALTYAADLMARYADDADDADDRAASASPRHPLLNPYSLTGLLRTAAAVLDTAVDDSCDNTAKLMEIEKEVTRYGLL